MIYLSMCGHSFTFFSLGRFDDPPADARCSWCNCRFDSITTMHFCLGHYAQHQYRVAFVHALQGTE